MLNELTPNDTFCDYYQQWVAMYKEGAVRDVTLSKYRLACAWLQRLIPLLTLAELNRITYQKLLNDYAVSHERQTTMDFHHQLKGAVLDAVDEGLVERDPTRKAGVSIASVAKRLGHASMNTTQKTYLHIIQELENQDVDLVMRSISSLI